MYAKKSNVSYIKKNSEYNIEMQLQIYGTRISVIDSIVSHVIIHVIMHLKYKYFT